MIAYIGRMTTTRFGKGSSVPVLSHDGIAIQGSAAIISYLDEISPEKPLTPSDPSLRAEALAWERWLDADVGPAVRRYCYHTLLGHRDISTAITCNKSAHDSGKSRAEHEDTRRELFHVRRFYRPGRRGGNDGDLTRTLLW